MWGSYFCSDLTKVSFLGNSDNIYWNCLDQRRASLLTHQTVMVMCEGVGFGSCTASIGQYTVADTYPDTSSFVVELHWNWRNATR
jgi:hypothetical protein